MDDNNSYGHMIGRKATILGLIYLAVILIICLIVWKLDGYAPVECNSETASIFLKRFTDCAGLANLGDFLAGVFAPLAFIGLAAAFLMQREQLRLTIEDNRKNQISRDRESALNYASVQTNYQLALFDKRLKAYHSVMEARSAFITQKPDSPETALALQKTLVEAEFIFDGDLYDHLMHLTRLAFMQADKAKRFHDLAADGGHTELRRQQAEQRDKAFKEWDKARDDLYQALVFDDMREKFAVYIRMPKKIEPDYSFTK